MDIKDYLNSKEAARYLTNKGYKVNARTLANKRWNGTGPKFHKFFEYLVRYTKKDLDAFLENGRKP